jgi:uncharacterized protein YegL
MDDEVFVGVRRLPVYLLVDCSGSMAGEPVAAMEMGIKTLLSELRNDPQAMETVWLSVIVFGTSADQAIPLTDIKDFQEPNLEAAGTTSLGEAITLLAERMDEEVRTTTEEQKGDWKPLVFVFTDGEPTDDWEEPVDDFHASGRAITIACGAGPEVDVSKLERLGEKVVRLNDTQPGTLSAFMKWVTASVTMTSKTLGTQAMSGPELPEPPEDEGITIIE